MTHPMSFEIIYDWRVRLKNIFHNKILFLSTCVPSIFKSNASIFLTPVNTYLMHSISHDPLSFSCNSISLLQVIYADT